MLRARLQMARRVEATLVTCGRVGCAVLADIVMRRKDEAGEQLIGVCSEHEALALKTGYERYGVVQAWRPR